MKKVLIITYYWPPSGGGGVQRWLKFTKYLPKFGWQPIVLTPSNPSVREIDTSLSEDISSTVKVIKIPIWEPYAISSMVFNTNTIPKQGIVPDSNSILEYFLVWIRGNLFIPDTRIFWRKKVLKTIKNLVKAEKIDLVITTGPPHSLHKIGFKIKKIFAIPWIVDFRDPWSDWDILDQMKLTCLSRKLHESQEKKIVKNANGLITVSNNWAKDLQKKYKLSVKVITNGFDSERLIKPQDIKNKKFRISHFGLINRFRNTPTLWDVLEKICNENQTFYQDLELFFAGNIDNAIFEKIKGKNFFNKIKYANYIPHRQLQKEYELTSTFLLLSNNTKNSKGHIPGKLFDYLFYEKPVLALCRIGGDIANIIEKTSSGYALEFNDKIGIEKSILNLYELYKSKMPYHKHQDINQYEAKKLTEKLAGYMNEIEGL
jgi:glycosyltransferase involved in cell wall biosynthesis